MKNVLLVYAADGRITYLASNQDAAFYREFYAPLGVHEILEADLDTHLAQSHYILNETLTPRPLQTTVLTGHTLTHLPNPCTLYIDGTPYAVSDTTVILDLTLPGTYSLRVEAFPYLDWTGEVTA